MHISGIKYYSPSCVAFSAEQNGLRKLNAYEYRLLTLVTESYSASGFSAMKTESVMKQEWSHTTDYLPYNFVYNQSHAIRRVSTMEDIIH